MATFLSFITGWVWIGSLLSLLTCLLISLVSLGIARTSSSLFYPTVSHGSRYRNRVALTFDDGPDPVTTPALLDLLANKQAKATFFVIGRKLGLHPVLGQRMVADGHAIGNHSWQHSRLQNFQSSRWHMIEMGRCFALLDTFKGNPHPRLYRPPVGLKSGFLAKAACHFKVTLVAWSLHSRDTRLHTPEAIAERVLDNVKPGDIILLHDGHDLEGQHRPHCLKAVELILTGLENKNLECVTVPDLLNLEA